jgi:hypothetical protein
MIKLEVVVGLKFTKSNWQGSYHLRVKGFIFWTVYSHLDAIHYRGKRASTLSAFGSSCGKLRAELSAQKYSCGYRFFEI